MIDARPSLSVLLPVRDAAGTLDESVRSVRTQSFRDWELIAVDDGSRDASVEILRRHAAEDGRIRVVEGRGRGLVAALETGRAVARAPLLARMDADDVADPDRFSLQIDLLRDRPEVALCGTHVRYFPTDRVRGGARRYERWLNGHRRSEDLVRDLWIECPLAHPTFLLRAAALDRIGGYRDMGWPEDYDLVLRLWETELAMAVVPRVLLHWRESEGRLSRQDPRYGAEAFRRLKLHFLSRTLLRGRSGIVVWGAGPTGKAFARTAIRVGIPVRAFVELDPGKVGQEIHGAPVVDPSALGAHRDALVVAAVGKAGARTEIRAALRTEGWIEGREFVAVA